MKRLIETSLIEMVFDRESSMVGIRKKSKLVPILLMDSPWSMGYRSFTNSMAVLTILAKDADRLE